MIGPIEVLSIAVAFLSLAGALIKVSNVISKLEATDDKFTLMMNGILERQEHSRTRLGNDITELRTRLLAIEEHLLKNSDFKR